MKRKSDAPFPCWICKDKVVFVSKEWELYACQGCGQLYEEDGSEYSAPPGISVSEILDGLKLPAPFLVETQVPRLGTLKPVASA